MSSGRRDEWHSFAASIAHPIETIGPEVLFYKKQYEEFLRVTLEVFKLYYEDYQKLLEKNSSDFHEGNSSILESLNIATRNREPLTTISELSEHHSYDNKELYELTKQLNAVIRTINALIKEPTATNNAPTSAVRFKNSIIKATLSLNENYYVNADTKAFVKKEYPNRVSDLQIIKKTRHPVIDFFEQAIHVISSLCIIGAGLTIARIHDSVVNRGHWKFWKPAGYDLKCAVKRINNEMDAHDQHNRLR